MGVGKKMFSVPQSHSETQAEENPTSDYATIWSTWHLQGKRLKIFSRAFFLLSVPISLTRTNHMALPD